MFLVSGFLKNKSLFEIRLSPPPNLPHQGGGIFIMRAIVPLPWWEGLGEGEMLISNNVNRIRSVYFE
jgi:hypothetical protein